MHTNSSIKLRTNLSNETLQARIAMKGLFSPVPSECYAAAFILCPAVPNLHSTICAFADSLINDLVTHADPDISVL